MNRKLDFLKNTIIKKLVISTSEDIAEEYHINLFVIECFEETMRTGMPFGKMLTEYDILELYLEGVTFREIGYLKGITKEGVRLVFNRLPVDKEKVQKEHRRRRGELWDTIRKERVLEEVERVGIESAASNLGYTLRYIKILLLEIEKRGKKV